MNSRPPMIIPAQIDDSGLSVSAFRVYAHLCRRANGSGECWPAAPSIAETCRIHRDTVWRCLTELEQRGLILRGKGQRNSNLYRIVPLNAVSGNKGPTHSFELAESDGRQLAESHGCRSTETEGLASAETEGREGYPAKGIQRRGSSEGGSGTLDHLPVELSEIETASSAEALGIRTEEVADLYVKFRDHKNGFPRDWQHLRRTDLRGIFVTWVSTSSHGKALLRANEPARGTAYVDSF